MSEQTTTPPTTGQGEGQSSPPAINTPSANQETTGENQQGRGNYRGGNRGPRTRGRQGRNQAPATIFNGDNPEVGAVIGIRAENSKNSFKNFQEKLARYVMSEYEYGRDIVAVVKTVDDFNIEEKEPSEPGPTTDASGAAVPVSTSSTTWRRYEMEYKEFLSRARQFEENKAKLYSLVLGQCTHALRAELKGLEEYEDQDSDFNCVWLLQQVKLISSGVEQRVQNPYESIFLLMRSLVNMRQGEHETCDAYATRFRDMIHTIELAGISCTVHESLLEHELKKEDLTTATASDEAIAEATEKTMENFKAVLMLENADPKRFKGLWNDLRSDMAKGTDVFPTTQVATFDLLNHWDVINNRGSRNRTRGPPELHGRQFYQGAELPEPDVDRVRGSDGRLIPHIKCFTCNKYGHYSDN